MSDYPLVLQNVSATANGSPILKSIDLRLESGSITGLLGRNGSGKTTLLKSALGLFPGAVGDALVFGEPVLTASPRARTRLGYVPQTMSAFRHMTIGHCLKVVGGFYHDWDMSFVDLLRDEWRLSTNARISSLSAGQLQLVSILVAIGHRPDLLVLDEPMAALDPVARRNILKRLIEMNVDQGQTILLSSHIVSDLERVVSDIAILHGGQLIYHGALDQLKSSLRCLEMRGPKLPSVVTDSDVLGYQVFGKYAQAWTLGWSEQRVAAFSETHRVEVQTRSKNLEDAFIGVTS